MPSLPSTPEPWPLADIEAKYLLDISRPEGMLNQIPETLDIITSGDPNAAVIETCDLP